MATQIALISLLFAFSLTAATTFSTWTTTDQTLPLNKTNSTEIIANEFSTTDEAILSENTTLDFTTQPPITPASYSSKEPKRKYKFFKRKQRKALVMNDCIGYCFRSKLTTRYLPYSCWVLKKAYRCWRCRNIYRCFSSSSMSMSGVKIF